VAVLGAAAGLQRDDALDLDLGTAPLHPDLVRGVERGRDLVVGQAQDRQHGLLVEPGPGLDHVGNGAGQVGVSEVRHARTLQGRLRRSRSSRNLDPAKPIQLIGRADGGPSRRVVAEVLDDRGQPIQVDIDDLDTSDEVNRAPGDRTAIWITRPVRTAPVISSHAIVFGRTPAMITKPAGLITSTCRFHRRRPHQMMTIPANPSANNAVEAPTVSESKGGRSVMTPKFIRKMLGNAKRPGQPV